MACEINVDSRLPNSPLRRKPNVLIGQKPRSTDLGLLESYTSCTDPRLPGALQVAQQMANHESARTTGLYDRRDDEVSLDEVEKIVI